LRRREEEMKGFEEVRETNEGFEKVREIDEGFEPS
jgi:hypothetical protein